MKSFFISFVFAARGIVAALKTERNLKVQSIAACTVIAAAFYFNVTSIEWCILLLTIGLVLSLELMNTSLEKVVDLITTERNPLVGKIKDIAAGAVLVVSLVALVVGLIIFSAYLHR